MPPHEDAGEPGKLAAAAPDVLAQLLHVAHDQELAQLREHIEELAEVHRSHLMERDRCLATVYPGPDVVAERLAQVRAAARGELRCLVHAGGWRPRAGLAHRTVAEGAPEPDAGPAVRWLPELPVTMYLADDTLGVVVRPGGDGVIVVYPSLLLEALGELFEALWARADPQAARGPAAERDQLADLLLTGLTDQAIGNQLGVGLRTVQRRIAALLAELGAVTRFQAGVQTGLRGGPVPDTESARPDDPAGRVEGGVGQRRP